MNLAEKMFTSGIKSCPVRSDCQKESDREYFDSLFETDWEVFVVKRDNMKGQYDWFTLCCEEARRQQHGKRNELPASGC